MGIVVAPDDKHAYVTTGHGGTVIVIDTDKDEVTGSIPVGKRPWGIGIAPDGKTLYTANGFSDDVSIVDVAARAETGRIHVGSKPWGLVASFRLVRSPAALRLARALTPVGVFQSHDVVELRGRHFDHVYVRNGHHSVHRTWRAMERIARSHPNDANLATAADL